jgi:hypothetical protein
MDALSTIGQTLEAMTPPAQFAIFSSLLKESENAIGSLVSALLNNQPTNPVHKQFRYVSNRLRKEIQSAPLSKVILFLPYKASMWGSLASIWRAAADDPNCLAYVVPIPYYDKRPDGSFAQMHYEGDQFPEDVPIIPFEQLDMATLQPDVTYIHNPYDSHNYVTSVHPSMYTAELKKHTKQLVFVPYYVHGGNIEGSGPEWAATICSANVLITANEAQAEALKRSIEEDSEAQKNLPRKTVLALGSPKVDAVLYAEDNKPPMPPEWQSKLAGKKVFFLNASISAALQHGEDFLKKLESVIDVFKDREDAALLWRPHPLMPATLR